MANRYQFESELTGYINVYEDSGKYNNRCFSYTITDDAVKEAEKDRKELLKWVDSKVDADRTALQPAPWRESTDGMFIKYSYADGGSKQIPIFVDSEGTPIPKEMLRSVGKGTKAVLTVQQKPYTKPNRGTSMNVLIVQITKLVTFEGASDSGALDEDQLLKMVGKRDGFKVDSPAVMDSREESSSGSDNAYDF